MTHDEAYPRLEEIAGLHSAAPDTAALRAHAGTCPVCAERLARLVRVERALGAPLERHPAPAGLGRAVLEIPDLHPRARGPSRPLRRRIAGLAAVAAAAAVLAGILVARTGPDVPAPAPGTVALRGGAGVHGVVSLASASGEGQTVRLVMDGMAGSRSYGLWLVGPQGSVLAASFTPRRDGRCVVVARVPRDAWTRVAVTRDGRPPSPGATLASADL